jgi:hypothetical protein
MAKFAANICEYVAAEFDDDYERIFWCTSFSSMDFEELSYRFDTDYNERFVVHFNFNDFTIQVCCGSAKGSILIKKYEIGCFLSLIEE